MKITHAENKDQIAHTTQELNELLWRLDAQTKLDTHPPAPQEKFSAWTPDEAKKSTPDRSEIEI